MSEIFAETTPTPSRRELTARLLHEAAQARGKKCRALQDRVVELNMDVARETAHRYRSRGIPDADLEQVALLALVKAVRRFDPTKANDFLSYAVPTMRGEVRRHFRDQGWAVRPPRSIQELQAGIASATEQLSQELGRPPEPRQIAARLEVSEAQVHEAMAANGCFTPTSLDALPVGGDENPHVRRLGCEDRGFEQAEARVALQPVLGDLSERERRILELRFVRGLTQAEIGDEIGVTQMQVSRLLSALLLRLRSRLQAA